MLHKKGKFKKGIYRPKNRQKFLGKKYPLYRSSWELHFFKWCDSNPNVLEWTSEHIAVPYISPMDSRTHRYFIDSSLVLREKGGISKYIVEIKPFKQTQKPKRGRKKESTFLHEKITYDVNLAKWAAAKKWAEIHGYKFLILTEKELF